MNRMEKDKEEVKENKENIEQKSIDSKSKIKKKPNWKKIGILIAIIIVIALIVFLIWKFTNEKSDVQEMVDINYNIQLEDNTFIDSGSEKFASGSVASFFNFATNKLDQEIAVMALNEEKTITLEPKDAYGEYDENLVFNYNKTLVKDKRSQEMNRTISWSIDEFKQIFNEVPLADKTYETTSFVFPFKVLEVKEEDNEVKLSIEATVGEEIFSGILDLNLKVTSVTSDKIILKLQGENKVYSATETGSDIDLEIIFTNDEFEILLKPEIGQWIELPEKPRAKVTSIDDTYLNLDSNSEYASKKIIITITLNNRYKKESSDKTKIPGAPTMQFFIMSHCPYGLQMLKGILPVWEKFQNIANIELRFVGYTMHGQEEEDNNYRMICIREEQNSKLIPYLNCFVEAGDYESCFKQAGVDETKLNICMEGKVVEYYAEDQALNDQYGVQGSPTTVLNGQVTEIYPRSPEDIKKALCGAFSTQPNECSETLSNENPSAGFGWGTGGGSGSC